MAIKTVQLVEREGKHYLVFPDGEYELSPGYLMMLNRYDKLALTVIERKIQYLNWGRAMIPAILAMPHTFAEPIDKAKKRKRIIHKTTYLWQGDADKELPELYRLMTGSKYQPIASETTIEQFTAIFKGQPTDTIAPIRWLASNRLLAYFLDTAFSGEDWQSIAGHGKLFENKKGKILTANDLSSAKKQYSDSGPPKGYEEIDRILKEIKNLKNLKSS